MKKKIKGYEGGRNKRDQGMRLISGQQEEGSKVVVADLWGPDGLGELVYEL